MYKKICLLGDKNQFIPFDYSQKADIALQSMGLNSGNNVFGFALQKMTLTKTQCVDMVSLSHFFNFTAEINEKYDAILYSPANILAPWTKDTGLRYWIEALRNITIPVYFVDVGSQSDKYYDLDFVKEFKDTGYTFVKLLLKTGGRIGLRGYFTAEVMKKLGFSEQDFEVVGCPSLFMNGPDLKINKKNLKKEELKPIFNGNHFWFNDKFHKLFGEYPHSVFICQDLFYRLLYDYDSLTDEDGKYLRADLFEWLFQGHRVRLYCDYLAWYNDIAKENFNFCIGSRIHSNIVSLLAGIPSFVDSFDSRVREMAEFFDIPYGDIGDESIDIYDLYQKISFYKFNATFAEKFARFKSFMNECGLPCFEDKKYIDKQVACLRFQSPRYRTDLTEIKAFTRKYWKFYYPDAGSL